MHNITLDFSNPGLPQVIDVMQSDAQSRFIGITLYDGGVPYSAPSGAQYTVQYRGSGANNMGWYDTIQLSSGTRKAVTVDSSNPNVVTLELAEQALRVNGKVEVSLCVVNNTGYKLNTFPIICRVTGAPYVDPVAVRSYFYVTGLTSEQWLAYVTACQDAQKRAEDAAATFETDPTLSVEGKAADAKATGKAVGEIKEDIVNERQIINILNYAISSGILTFEYNETNWTIGWIDPNTGVENTDGGHRDFGRMANFNQSLKGIESTIVANASKSVKIYIVYYDKYKNFIKNVYAGNDTAKIDTDYPFYKIQCVYVSGEDMNLDDLKKMIITNRIKISKELYSLPEIGIITNTKVDVDLNALHKGLYYIQCDKNAEHKLLNAPNGDNYGIYNMLVFKSVSIDNKNDHVMQICFSDKRNEHSASGIYYRFLDVTNNKVVYDWIRVGNNKSNNNYLALGDSITYGYLPSGRASLPYPKAIATALGLNVEYGAQTGAGFIYPNGEITAMSIVDFYCKQGHDYDFNRYNLVTIAFGTNDYGNNYPLGDINDLYPTNKTVCGAVNYCIDKIYSNNPKINLVFILPINACDVGTAETNYRYGTVNEAGYTLIELCNKIKGICDKYGINYIDNSHSVVNKMNVDKGIFVDRLHPTNEFYKILGQYYTGKISSYFSPLIN